MRIAIVSDVHSNLEGLEAVLHRAEEGGAVDAVWCLGDVVGYGPEPSAVLARLRMRRLTCVAGNHDMAACGRMGVEDFNQAAAEAALWTAEQLSVSEREFLRELPLAVTEGAFTLVHGSLRYPEWEYLLSGEQALAQFELQGTPYSLVGHSHLPFWVEEDEPGRTPAFHPADDGAIVKLGEQRLIINPGQRRAAARPRPARIVRAVR